MNQTCQIIKDSKIISIAKKRDILKYFCTHKSRVISSEDYFKIFGHMMRCQLMQQLECIKNLREIVKKEKLQQLEQ